MNNHTIRDRIMGRSSLAPLKVPAFTVLSAVQDQTPDIRIEALILTATILALGAGIDPHDLIVRAKRQIAAADTIRNPLIEAIQAFATGEIN